MWGIFDLPYCQNKHYLAKKVRWQFVIVPSDIYDKRDDFDFEIVNFPFLDGYAPRSTS